MLEGAHFYARQSLAYRVFTFSHRSNFSSLPNASRWLASQVSLLATFWSQAIGLLNEFSLARKARILVRTLSKNAKTRTLIGYATARGFRKKTIPARFGRRRIWNNPCAFLL